MILAFSKGSSPPIRIDPAVGRAADGQLFSTSGLRLRPRQQLLCAVDTTTWDAMRPAEAFPDSFDVLSGLGGERGLARFVARSGTFAYPDTWPERSSGLRMILITPAIFKRGWLPGWLDPSDYSGVIPGTGVQVRLRSGIVDRWRPVSGWDLQHRRPKPMRRMVPAGSVYFFEVLDWGRNGWKDLWFRSVADDPQDQRDGFGVIVCGAWHY
ncbi:MAG: type III-B CRISPR module-associated protein Cmr3 [Alicyclobacillus sp.]|nr:type III-B CRISPR module-associated protein Cmr3 [Alicyclobacillus sp.]